MKTWGLILVIVATCAACSTPRSSVPSGLPTEPYVGPATTAPVDFDRADATGRPAPRKTTRDLSCEMAAQCTMLMAAF